jgi:hypothetical protein
MAEESTQTDGVIDTRRWTGLNDDPPLDPVQRRKVILLAWLGAAAFFLILGTINSIGMSSQTASATLFGTDHVPAQWVGRQWSEEHWNLRLLVNGEDAVMRLQSPPPAWAIPGRQVIVTYGHGRLFHDIQVQNLQPAPSGERPASP